MKLKESAIIVVMAMAVFALLLSASGCANTISGAGELISGVGQDWQDAASKQMDNR